MFALTIVLLLLGVNIEFLLLAIVLESCIYTAFDNLKKSKNLYKLFSKVNLRQSKFNDSFDIYSPNLAEVKQVLTPAFMERFYNLKKIFNSKDIRCSFFEDKIMIAIQSKQDLFELGNIFKPINDSSNIEKFYSELTSIFDIIDSLNIK